MFTSIVVGTDGSPTAAEAVRKARDLARTCGARLHVVSAYKSAGALAALSAEAIAAGATPADAVRLSEEIGEMTRAMLDQLAKEVSESGVEVHTHAVPGEPAHVILDLADAEAADLIVVGNRGMGSARRFVLGSVPNKISHHAPCSVLVVGTS